ncbi:MAG: radical SAM protein [Bacteroidales bacterium]|nr:radical SAM protein [Bacteroidales bacterium]
MPKPSPFLKALHGFSEEHRPICAAIEVTNRCNAECQYCYIRDRKSSPELSTKQIHFVIDKLNQSELLYINITGGEPFLRADILEILEHCFSSNFLFCSIFSNGTAVKKKHIEFLKKYKDYVKPFRMTVFSHYDHLHNSYMGIPDSLNDIEKTGRKLLDAGVAVHLSIPVMPFNILHLEESILYFKNQGFTIGKNSGKLITQFNDTPLMRYMISKDFFKLIYSKESDDQIASRLKLNTSTNEKNHRLCKGLHSLITIDINGNIHPCTSFRNFIIGSIFSDATLEQILNSNSEYTKLKNLTIDDIMCKNCENAQICIPCIANSHSLYGTFDGPYIQSCNNMKAIREIAKERGLA